MSEYTRAKVQDGTYYEGNQMFRGVGTLRSCGKCAKHRSVAGGRHHKLYGWVCKDCKPKAVV